MQRSELSESVPVSQTERKRKRTIPVLLLFGSLLLVLLWFGIKSYRVGTAVQSLLGLQAEASLLLDGDVTALDPEATASLVASARENIVTIKQETALFMPLMPYLGWVPRFGPTLVAAPALLEMADAGSETAALVFPALQPALTLMQTETESESSQLSQLVRIIAAAEPSLQEAAVTYDRLLAARAELGEPEALPWRIQALLEQTDPLLPLGHDGLHVALVLPELMGLAEPRTYLLIIQNEDELRATGGFMTGAGLLRLAGGEIDSLTFADSSQIDNWQDKPYDLPPDPLYKYMGLELFLYRDANYWPDFPTSAETALRLYSYGQDLPEPDGAIAIDQRFVEQLLAGIGPVAISDSDLVLNEDNVRLAFQQAWSGNGEVDNRWYIERKAFFTTFGLAVQGKILSGLSEIDPLALATNLHDAAESKHLQIYMRSPEVSAVFNQLNWDGRLENPGAQDVLAVVDTNTGFNKVNMFVEPAINYEVILGSDGQASAMTTLLYENRAALEPGNPDCVQDTWLEYNNQPDYVELADECYWNFVRIYTPDGSRLTDSSFHSVPDDSLYLGSGREGYAEELVEFAGWTTFANFTLIPRQGSGNVSFAYDLPATVIRQEGAVNQYALHLIPQAGTSGINTAVTVQLPPGSTLLSATPAKYTQNGDRLQFELILAKNETLSVSYTD